MRTKLMLDTNILARICHPIKHRDVQAWFQSILDERPPTFDVVVSAITFYELQRALRKVGASRSMEQLSELAKHLSWLPITVETAKQAAELWSRLGEAGAQERDRISDADILIGAQAMREGAVLVSSDGALARCGALVGLEVRDWSRIRPAAG